MKIGIVGAMAQEVEILSQLMSAQQEILIVHEVFHQTTPLLAERAHDALVIL